MTAKFLYIEDQEDSCDLVRSIFDSTEIVCVPTKKDALRLLKKDPQFDLFLIDHYLPDGLGLGLCREIRSRDRSTPIVFVTASSSLSIHDVRDAGGQGLVKKASANFVKQLRQTVTDLTV